MDRASSQTPYVKDIDIDRMFNEIEELKNNY
jgi:hypothetical protein